MNFFSPVFLVFLGSISVNGSDADLPFVKVPPEQSTLVQHGRFEWKICQQFNGKPVPAPEDRKTYRKSLLDTLQNTSLKIMGNYAGDYRGYQDCLKTGIARPGSILGDCAFKKRHALESAELYRNLRRSQIIASTSFSSRPATGSDSPWDEMRISISRSNILPFGKSPTPPSRTELTMLSESIEKGQTAILDKVLADLSARGGSCFTRAGSQVRRNPDFHQDGRCYTQISALKNRSQMYFTREAQRQLNEDAAQIIAKAPWAAFMDAKLNELEDPDQRIDALYRGFERLIGEIDQNQKKVRSMKPGELGSDGRIPLISEKDLVEVSLELLAKNNAANSTDGLSENARLHNFCSAAQEIHNEIEAGKVARMVGLFGLGVSGGLVCFFTGTLPCIAAGTATGVLADAIDIRGIRSEQTDNVRSYLSGNKSLSGFRRDGADLDGQLQWAYVLLPTSPLVPFAIKGAFRTTSAAVRQIMPSGSR